MLLRNGSGAGVSSVTEIERHASSLKIVRKLFLRFRIHRHFWRKTCFGSSRRRARPHGGRAQVQCLTKDKLTTILTDYPIETKIVRKAAIRMAVQRGVRACSAELQGARCVYGSASRDVVCI